MAGKTKPGRLREMARERNQTEEVFIGQAIAETGSLQGAAAKLGVSRNTLDFWMKRNGYELEVETTARLVKVTEEAEHA